MLGAVSRPPWLGRVIVAVALLGVLVAPVVFDRDSFPLSTYPMYAHRRGGETTVATAIGIDAAGREHRLSLALIADSDDPLIVASAVRGAVADGRADETCRQIAARATGRGLVAVAVVSERHDAVARASGEPSLVARETHSRCEVEP